VRSDSKQSKSDARPAKKLPEGKKRLQSTPQRGKAPKKKCEFIDDDASASDAEDGSDDDAMSEDESEDEDYSTEEVDHQGLDSDVSSEGEDSDSDLEDPKKLASDDFQAKQIAHLRNSKAHKAAFRGHK